MQLHPGHLGGGFLQRVLCRPRAVVLLALFPFAACMGDFGANSGPGGSGPGAGPGGSTSGSTPGSTPGMTGTPMGTDGSGATPGTGMQPPDSVPPSAAAGDFSFSPGVRRLTRAEYAASVLDLVGVAVERSEQPKELIIKGTTQIAGAQKTGYEDTSAFLSLAEKVATAAAPKLAMEIACADAACYRTWASGFLLRAFREPPPAALLDRYAGALTSTTAGATPADRVVTFLMAVLSSPHFLYRKEIGTPVAGGEAGLRNLTAHEVAARLSYLVWAAGPDPMLAGAASNGMLAQPAQRVAHLDRMLKDPRGLRALRAFVADWMLVQDNLLPNKDTLVLMGTTEALPRAAERGMDLLVDDVFAARDTARFGQLLGADFAFVNADLAKVMGVSGGTADQFVKAMLNVNERRGILTHPLVIAAHSKESGASPFPLGKFIYENVLCEEIPPPPPGMMFPVVEDTPASTQTLRQQLEAMTSVGVCKGCHDRIGPTGFAFLPFDPIGRYNNKDARGMPYDTKGSLPLAGITEPLQFDGASDLSAKLASHVAVQRCVARRLFRTAFGRYESDADGAVLAELEKGAEMAAGGVAELMRKMVSLPGFGQVKLR